MATENLGLNTINSSDIVSVTPFNENFAKLDALGIDYVVEQGTSGAWWYRKWKSGRAECIIEDKNFGQKAHTLKWGSMWCTDNTDTFGAYPFTFAKKPLVIFTFNGDQYNASAHQSYVVAANSTSTATSPYFRVIDPNSGTFTELHCGIYVNGWYK